MVAVGMGVSVGAGVSVGMLICATAVSKAAVMMILGSTVAGAGWQDANRRASRPRLRKKRFFVMRRIVPIKKGHSVAVSLLNYSSDLPEIKSSTLSRQMSSRNCLGGVLKK